MYTRTCVHMVHACACPFPHRDTVFHICVHRHRSIYIYTHTHTFIYMYPCMCPHTCRHRDTSMPVSTYMSIRAYRSAHTCVHMYAHKHNCPRTRTYAIQVPHSCTHRYTDIQACSHTPRARGALTLAGPHGGNMFVSWPQPCEQELLVSAGSAFPVLSLGREEPVPASPSPPPLPPLVSLGNCRCPVSQDLVPLL